MALFNRRKNQAKNERSSVINSAKTLLANIRFMDVDNPVRTMAITSAVPNEGKTFIAANLASAIATSGKSVLIVECDMRRRSLSRALNVHAQYGIYSVMSGERTVQEAAVATGTPNMYFLDAEPRIPNPSDLLNSNRFSKLVDLARNTYDYVLFDTPPVGTFLFISCGVAKLPIEKAVKPLLPYIAVVLVVTVLALVFPVIVTGLPSLIYK